MWVRPTDPETIGLAGARQVIRLERVRRTLRQGKIVKTETQIVYAVTSLPPEKASPKRLLAIARGHWAIENGQHYRRDRTQDEDRCQVRNPRAARNLSLFRSLAIFLYEAQRHRSEGQRSLPDFERHIMRQPSRMIRRFLPD